MESYLRIENDGNPSSRIEMIISDGELSVNIAYDVGNTDEFSFKELKKYMWDLIIKEYKNEIEDHLEYSNDECEQVDTTGYEYPDVPINDGFIWRTNETKD